MNNQVFWDASAFIALSKQKDINHQRAIAISRQLATAQSQIVTTDAVLIEVANGLSAINLRPYAIQMIKSARHTAAQNMATIIHVTPKIWEQGWQLYETRPDKAWGMTDCISMVIMQDHQISTVFTADHHFEQAGFHCLLRN